VARVTALHLMSGGYLSLAKGSLYRATVARQAARRLRYLRTMDASRAAFQPAQDEALRALLTHAATHVPFYRAALSKAQCAGENWLRIPRLDRKQLRENFAPLGSDDADRRHCYTNRSGGSTGEPVRFLQDRNYAAWSAAVADLFDAWSGYTVGEAEVCLWGSERDFLLGGESARTRAGRWLRGERWLNAFRMSDANMFEYVDAINAAGAVRILGYADALFELAQFSLRRNVPLRPPRCVMSSAGTLHPWMRKAVSEAFRAPVYDRYGSREGGGIACQCSQREGLHISPLTHKVEILDDKGQPCRPGEVGEVHITVLHNYSMPLIRYRMGDMASWSREPCRCGSPWPTLERVWGRSADTLTTAGGVVPPQYFIHMIGVALKNGAVEKVQVTQKTLDHVIVRVIPAGEELSSDIRLELTRIVRRVLGAQCIVDIDSVAHIPTGPSGKFRYVVNEISDDYIPIERRSG
jgi:phenylacetate-CoA ligase